MKRKVNFIGLLLFLLVPGITFSFFLKAEVDSDPSIDPPIKKVEGVLVFTPNESFFSPVGTLLAHQKDKTSGNIYNKYENYDYIHSWSKVGDTILFGLNLKNKGNVKIQPEMAIAYGQNGSEIYAYLDSNRKEFTVASSGGEGIYLIQDGIEFKDVEPGFHVIKLQLKSLAKDGAEIGKLNKVHISGTGVHEAEVVMRRYRAKAVHCKWGTESTNPVEISVHELTIKSKTVSYYQPITTPFGYTGSTWNKDTQTFGGYNFSLWSYGAKDPIPPFYQESHLIAVGPGLKLGSYGHEGTGVKPRGNHAYIGIDTDTQTIAVRKLPGEKYDTYWSYYLDPVDGHWKLYGCGKKYNKKGTLVDLYTGAFVEVPGAASKVRSGHEICETEYRGWQRDTSGNWHPINKMIGTSRQNDNSFRDWRIVGNKFSMQMGGWGEPGIEKKTLTLSSPDPTPYFLKGVYLEELYKMPASFEDVAPIEIASRSAKLSFVVAELGTNASAEIFWGTEEGLTKEERWTNKKNISVINGVNKLNLDDLAPDIDYFYRIKITNDQGITWSYDTQMFKTIKDN